MQVIHDETIPIQHEVDVGQNGHRKLGERSHDEPRLQKAPARAGKRWTVSECVLLLVSLVMGALSHGHHLFLYPLYITDEGIYMQQAWSVLREGRLSLSSIGFLGGEKARTEASAMLLRT